MRRFQSVSGHSNEPSTAHYSSRLTVLQLKGVSDTISNWFENYRAQRTQISTFNKAPFPVQNSTRMASSLPVDRNRKFLKRTFSTSTIFKATSKLFGSLGCSDDKNWLDLSSILFKICRFLSSSSVAVRFHSTRSDERDKFDSGVIFLDQSKFFATHGNQWDCIILYRP